MKTLLSLHVSADDYVFTDDQARPVDQNEFGRQFCEVLRVLEIRPRRFYNTRHTFISVALTLGCNQKWIAEQTGTSIAMIQQNYGRYIGDDGDVLLRAYVVSTVSNVEPSDQNDANEPETETISGESVKYSGNMVVPTGIEPVLPT